MSDLVERVARVLMSPKADPSDWRFWTDEARAAIAVVLEEAAKVCDGVSTDVLTKVGREHEPYMRATAEDCAAAIRAMIPKET
jgi:hypothetical protein